MDFGTPSVPDVGSGGAELSGLTSEASLTKLAVILTCILACMVLLANLIVIVASRFAIGGYCCSLICVRSLCVADVLAGLFGVTKTILMVVQPRWVHCFLADSLLFCSILASSFTLVALTIDSYINLTNPRKYEEWLEKKTTLTTLIFLWNGAFIIGFIPQMGWNNEDHCCRFFDYYSSYYLFLVAGTFAVCLMIVFVLQLKQCHLVKQFHSQIKEADRNKARLEGVCVLIVTARLDLILQLLCYLPCLLFIVLHCHLCVLYTTDHLGDVYLFCFVPMVLAKSLLSTLLRGVRTAQIWHVITEFCVVCLTGKLFPSQSRSMHICVPVSSIQMACASAVQIASIEGHLVGSLPVIQTRGETYTHTSPQVKASSSSLSQGLHNPVFTESDAELDTSEAASGDSSLVRESGTKDGNTRTCFTYVNERVVHPVVPKIDHSTNRSTTDTKTIGFDTISQIKAPRNVCHVHFKDEIANVKLPTILQYVLCTCTCHQLHGHKGSAERQDRKHIYSDESQLCNIRIIYMKKFSVSVQHQNHLGHKKNKSLSF